MNLITTLILFCSFVNGPASKDINEQYIESVDVNVSPTLIVVAKDSTGQILDLTKEVSISMLTKLKIEVVVKGEINSSQNYQIAEMKVVHAKGASLVWEATVRSGDLNLHELLATIKSGDRFVITVKKVLTTNKAGKFVPVPVSNPVITIHVG